MKFFRPPYIFPILLLFNLLLLIKLRFFLPQLTGNSQLLDLETYYRLVKDVFMGINPYTVSYMQTLGPPTVLFYFLPFSLFNFGTAKFLFTFINMICGIATCYVLAKYFFQNNHSPRNASHTLEVKAPNLHTINIFLVLTLIFFSSFPVRFSIEMGQPNLVIGYLVSLLVCSVTRKKDFLTSLQNDKSMTVSFVLASIIILKTNYLIVLISLLKKNAALMTKTLITIIGIVVLLFPIIKPSFYAYYLTHKTGNLLPSVGNTQELNYYNQSIPARLYTLGLEHATIPLYVVSVLIILWIVYKSGNIILGIIASIILSPVSWQHYYAVLFPIFILVSFPTRSTIYIDSHFRGNDKLEFYKQRMRSNRFALIISFFFWWIEFPFLHDAEVNLFTAILSSHYLISELMLFFIIFKLQIRSHSASK